MKRSKKTFFVVVIGLLIICVIVFIILTGGKRFTHRNGICFGMTLDEVKAVEEKNGMTPLSERKWDWEGDTYSELYMPQSKYLGFDNSELSYAFKEEQKIEGSSHLICIRYFIIHDDNYTLEEIFDILQNALKNKYGESISNSEKASSDDSLFINSRSKDYKSIAWAAWLNEYNEGNVEIDLYNSSQNNAVILEYNLIYKYSENSNIQQKNTYKEIKQEELDKWL